tara:strand:+ start:117 stop:335 length:219 start_codon:yes stop_codon:yes gene_type:complete
MNAHIFLRERHQKRAAPLLLWCVFEFLLSISGCSQDHSFEQRGSLQMFVQLLDIVTLSKPRHPNDWQPTFYL